MNLLNRHKKPREMENLHVKATAWKTPAMEYFISIMIPGDGNCIKTKKGSYDRYFTSIFLKFYRTAIQRIPVIVNGCFWRCFRLLVSVIVTAMSGNLVKHGFLISMYIIFEDLKFIDLNLSTGFNT